MSEKSVGDNLGGLVNKHSHNRQPDVHSADSSIKLSGHDTTQTQTSEVRWAVHFSGHWVATSMFT